MFKKIVRWSLKGGLALLMVIVTAWAMTAIFYSNLPTLFLRKLFMVLYAVISILALAKIRPFRKAIMVFWLLFGIVWVWWMLIPPSNDRNWQPDLAVLPSATIESDKITVHNIRYCDYRSTTDFTVSHYDKTFDLSKLEGVDLFLCYWGPKAIAHTIMSFVFEGDQTLAISIETRKEIGEDYSAIQGFFKQFELLYVVADERDLIRLRTNFRGEDVYLYRLNAKPEMVRSVLLDYLGTINGLTQKPEWYNALTQNCTTAIRGHTKPYAHGRFSWKLIANGYLDTLLYERKTIDTSLPFEELKSRSRINEKSQNAGTGPDYSARIREGLPNPRRKTDS
jgi:hypothetical protein